MIQYSGRLNNMPFTDANWLSSSMLKALSFCFGFIKNELNKLLELTFYIGNRCNLISDDSLYRPDNNK